MTSQPEDTKDVFDVVCELDELSDWLNRHGYMAESELVAEASASLTGRFSLRLMEPIANDRE